MLQACDAAQRTAKQQKTRKKWQENAIKGIESEVGQSTAQVTTLTSEQEEAAKKISSYISSKTAEMDTDKKNEMMALKKLKAELATDINNKFSKSNQKFMADLGMESK